MEEEYFNLNKEQQEYLNIRIMKALFEMLYKTNQITKKEGIYEVQNCQRKQTDAEELRPI